MNLVKTCVFVILISAISANCVYQNKTYKLGSKINSADVCQMCWCRGRFNPQIQCRTRECPETEVPGGDNCHPLYEKDKCCPVGYECVAATDVNDGTQEKDM
uniref:U45-Eretoxin-Ek1a_1 n=1 Tax=Eresus cinnaberinus TaxID=175337 RepID=A0A2D0PCM9_ERECI